MFCQLLMLEGQHLTNYNIIDSYWFVSWWKPRKSAYSESESSRNVYKRSNLTWQRLGKDKQSKCSHTDHNAVKQLFVIQALVLQTTWLAEVVERFGRVFQEVEAWQRKYIMSGWYWERCSLRSLTALALHRWSTANTSHHQTKKNIYIFCGGKKY